MGMESKEADLNENRRRDVDRSSMGSDARFKKEEYIMREIVKPVSKAHMEAGIYEKTRGECYIDVIEWIKENGPITVDSVKEIPSITLNEMQLQGLVEGGLFKTDRDGYEVLRGGSVTLTDEGEAWFRS